MKAEELRDPWTEREELVERACIHDINAGGFGQTYFVLRWALGILRECAASTNEEDQSTVNAFIKVLAETLNTTIVRTGPIEIPGSGIVIE